VRPPWKRPSAIAAIVVATSSIGCIEDPKGPFLLPDAGPRAPIRDPAWAVWGSGPHDVYVATKRRVLHSDGGGSWIAENVPGRSFASVFGTSKNDVYVAGDDVYRSTGNGTWIPMHAPLPPAASVTLEWVWAGSPTDVWTTNGGPLLHFDGAAWSDEVEVIDGPVEPDPSRISERLNEYVDLHAMWASGATHVVVGEYLGPASSMVVGYAREKLPDGTWQVGPGNPDFGQFSFNTSVVGADLEHLWVGGARSSGYRGQILRWDGATWTPESLEIPPDPSGQPAYDWPTVTSLSRAPSEIGRAHV